MTNDPLIITCAVVGAELTKKDLPHLPTTPVEIANSAREAVNAGATIIHLHVRDENGAPTQRLDIFEDVTKQIRKQCQCILQYSTGGAVGTPIKERYTPLSLKPEMASLSMGTMNFGPDIFENKEETIRTIASAIRKNRVMPELEIFDCGMMDTLYRFQKKGDIPKNFHVNFVLGVPGGMGGHIENLIFLKNRLDTDQTWTVSGIGRHQLPLSVQSIIMGGHVRVGFEDNIYYEKGIIAKSNAQLVERVVRIAKECNRPIADATQAKIILGL